VLVDLQVLAGRPPAVARAVRVVRGWRLRVAVLPLAAGLRVLAGLPARAAVAPPVGWPGCGRGCRVRLGVPRPGPRRRGRVLLAGRRPVAARRVAGVRICRRCAVRVVGRPPVRPVPVAAPARRWVVVRLVRRGELVCVALRVVRLPLGAVVRWAGSVAAVPRAVRGPLAVRRLAAGRVPAVRRGPVARLPAVAGCSAVCPALAVVGLRAGRPGRPAAPLSAAPVRAAPAGRGRGR
jgi:hypothetical protein